MRPRRRASISLCDAGAVTISVVDSSVLIPHSSALFVQEEERERKRRRRWDRRSCCLGKRRNKKVKVRTKDENRIANH